MGRTDSSRKTFPRWLPPLARGLAIAAGHVAINAIAHRLSPSPLTYNLLWPGAGYALAVLCVYGLRYLPAIALPSLIFSTLLTHMFSFGLLLTGSLVGMVVAGVLTLRRRNVKLPITSTRDVLHLLLVLVVIMPLLAAGIVTVGRPFIHGGPPIPLPVIFAMAWTTVAAGVMFAAPTMLMWLRPVPWKWTVDRAIEAVALGGSGLAAGLVFYGGIGEPVSFTGVGYIAFPFLIWAALRFGLSGAASVASMFTLIAMWGTSHGRGLFQAADPALTVLYLDGFCVTLTATGLLIAAAVVEARQNATSLAASEWQYRRLTEQASDAILVGDADTHFLSANARATELLGYSNEEIKTMSIIDLIPPWDRAANPPRFLNLDRGGAITFERLVRCKDGRVITVEMSVTRLEDDRVQGILRDISARKHAESEMREAFSLLQATLESTTDGLLVVDLEGRIRSYNRKFVELWHIPQDILDSRDDARAIAFVLDQLRNPASFLANIQHLYDHPEETSFDVLEFKDGRVYERYSQGQSLGGLSKGRVWSFRDITLRTNLENQLRQAQKMEAVGSLAGGVAHDFNNLLTAIMGHSSLMLSRLSERDPLREDVAEIHRASERAALLTRQLLAFSRQQVIEPHVLDLNGVVLSMQQLLRRTLGENIQIQVRPAPAPAYVRADGSQIEQVILNLSINARDAMPLGGELTIETSFEHVAPDSTLALAPGEYVKFTFTDSGLGMDEATRQRIFEPFFTTKERGRGTGLGLSTVYGIVQQSGGVITVDSALARGSTFAMYFPRVAGEATAPAEVLPPAGAELGQGTVLLAEDEGMVRDLLAEALSEAGFSVIAVRDGHEAFMRGTAMANTIDIFVTDVVMPGMSGPDVVERLREHQPALPVLFISGYTDDELTPRMRLGPAVGFLQKPFPPATLIRRIREILDARPVR
jgi:two-component system, cell cycle sensor histidine kinase and response regulator CckA